MKKNKAMRLAAILLVCVLATTCVVGGTFAKYTSTATGSGSATVAKWAFKANDTAIDLTSAKTFTFNLFNTIKDSNGTDAETDVSANKIAPGTSGSFALKLTNASEVTATYAIAFTGDLKSVPLQFSTDGSTWKTSLSDIDVAATNIAIGADATVTVYWKWAFSTGDTGDAADTALGTAASPAQPSVTATVTFTQVD